MSDLHTTTVLDESGAATPRTLAGRYRLVRPIGAGGMAVVWEARDLALGRRVAVKVPSVLQVDPDPSSTARILREARLAALVNHPGVTSVFDVGVANGRPFIVMELIEGPTLAAVVGSGALSKAEAVRIGAAVADALAALHRHGVVHGDVKPANVILTSDGRPMLSDLGIGSFVGRAGPPEADGLPPGRDPAGNDAETHRYGTLPYAAPEVRGGEVPSPASDVFALGVMLREMGVGTGGPTEEAASACSSAMAIDPRARPSAASIAAILPGSDAMVGGATDQAGAQRSHETYTLPAAASTEVLVDGTTRLPTIPPVAPSRRRRIRMAVVAAICAAVFATIVGLGLTAADQDGRVAPTVPPRSVSMKPSPKPAVSPVRAAPPSPTAKGQGHGRHKHHKHGHGGD